MPITLDGSNVSTVGVPNRATAQNSTSGTSIDFTGIPANTRQITVLFNGVSTTGTSVPIIQLGTSASYTSSGYLGAACTGATFINLSTGFAYAATNTAARVIHGTATIINVSSNIWVFSSVTGLSNEASMNWGGGSISLAGTLDRVRITTVGGTDTFDAGVINILYQ